MIPSPYSRMMSRCRALQVIVAGRDPQTDMVASLLIDLEHARAIQPSDQSVVPLIFGPIREFDLDLDRVRRRGLGLVVVQMMVQCGEHCAAAGAEVPKAELQRVENRGLPGVVLPDQDGDRPQPQVEVTDPTEVPDPDCANTHALASPSFEDPRGTSLRASNCNIVASTGRQRARALLDVK